MDAVASKASCSTMGGMSVQERQRERVQDSGIGERKREVMRKRAGSHQGWESGGGRRKWRAGWGETGKGRGCSEEGGDAFREVDIGSLTLSLHSFPGKTPGTR